MFEILKRNYIDVFCYTHNANSYEYFPIRDARNFIPEWWKNIPTTMYSSNIETSANKLPTMKRCPGIIEHYKRGFMIPLWTDIEIAINSQEWNIVTADGSQAESHPDYQKGQFLSSGNWFHLKLDSPWFIETSHPLDFIHVQPHWNYDELNSDMFVPSAYDTFYEANHSTSIQLFVNRSTDRVLNLFAGMPMIHYIPITDKKIRLHTEFNKERTNTYLEKNNKFSFDSLFYKKKKQERINVL